MNTLKKFLEKYPLPAIFALMAAALLPMIFLRDMSPSNELRYLSIVEEALRGGHLFTFTNQGEIYTDKPPLFFWGLMLCRAIFGYNYTAAALVLFGLLPTFVIMWTMDRWLCMACKGGEGTPAGARPSPAFRAAAALMCATTVYVLFLAAFLRMDTMMVMFIILALFTFYRMYTGEMPLRRGQWLLPVYTFLALFTKGPVGVLVPPVAIIVFLLIEKQPRSIGKHLGWRMWVVSGALCAVWFGAVYAEGGSEYLSSLLFHQTVDRAVNAFHHKKPFWYYLPTIIYVALPYAFATIPVLAASLRKGRVRSSFEQLLVCIILSTFVMLSAFSSKLAIYLLPIIPFLSYLLPYWLIACGDPEGKEHRWVLGCLSAGAILMAATALAGLIFLIFSGSQLFAPLAEQVSLQAPYIFSPFAAAALGLLLTGSTLAAILYLRGRSFTKGTIAMSVSLLLTAAAAAGAMPKANAYVGYREVCRKAVQLYEESQASTDGSGALMKAEPTYSTLFVRRPENMDWYLGRDIVNYGDDAEGFMAAEHHNEVLILKHRKETPPPVPFYLTEQQPHATVGEFIVIYFP